MFTHHIYRSRATRWIVSLPFAVATGVAQAQEEAPQCAATLVYGPMPTSVPSLTTWGILILASVLGLMAVQRMRMGNGAKHWAVLLGLAFVLAAGSGGMVVNQAWAATASLSIPAGGSIILTSDSTTLTNTTTIPLTISSLTATGGSVAPGTTCQVGQQLAPNASCDVTLQNCTEGGSGGGGGWGGS